MENKRTKRSSTSHVIRELQIKATMRYRYIPLRLAKIKNWQYHMLTRLWSKNNSHSLLVRMQNDTATLEDCLVFSVRLFSKLSIVSLYDPAVTNLDIYPTDLKTYPHKNLHMKCSMRSFIHNCPKSEATKISFKRWEDKQTGRSTRWNIIQQ